MLAGFLDLIFQNTSNFLSSSRDDHCSMLHRTIFVESLKFYLSYCPQGGKKATQLLITNTGFHKVKCSFKINSTERKTFT